VHIQIGEEEILFLNLHQNALIHCVTVLPKAAFTPAQHVGRQHVARNMLLVAVNNIVAEIQATCCGCGQQATCCRQQARRRASKATRAQGKTSKANLLPVTYTEKSTRSFLVPTLTPPINLMNIHLQLFSTP